ncbi:MAG TPA: toll/interleukin-1 receptor domain-containing protein [Rhizomicrobium sp.]|nr:toll/interleukin-1 receptor domain-containing protein [Rhizomicrobium sp.]
MAGDNRTAIFISHANPQDNAFTLWLGAKLAALGYEVWADVLRLKGGDDWQRKLEHALRHRTRKVLLVANAVAVDKQGVRNELQIANDVAQTIGDNEFIIPLRLSAFEAPFLIAQAQYIDFEKSWAAGLKDLLELIEPIPHPPSDEKNSVWRTLQQIHGKALAHKPEVLRSNWLGVETLPSYLYSYGFRSGVPEKRAAEAMESAPWPLAPERNRGRSWIAVRLREWPAQGAAKNEPQNAACNFGSTLGNFSGLSPRPAACRSRTGRL